MRYYLLSRFFVLLLLYYLVHFFFDDSIYQDLSFKDWTIYLNNKTIAFGTIISFFVLYKLNGIMRFIRGFRSNIKISHNKRTINKLQKENKKLKDRINSLPRKIRNIKINHVKKPHSTSLNRAIREDNKKLFQKNLFKVKNFSHLRYIKFAFKNQQKYKNSKSKQSAFIKKQYKRFPDNYVFTYLYAQDLHNHNKHKEAKDVLDKIPLNLSRPQDEVKMVQLMIEVEKQLGMEEIFLQDKYDIIDDYKKAVKRKLSA